ncbi:hypothetical protein L7F22_008159 [Adiantum nelumboides]|nr:hypothetical protein [Adiantum nelumboides]
MDISTPHSSVSSSLTKDQPPRLYSSSHAFNLSAFQRAIRRKQAGSLQLGLHYGGLHLQHPASFPRPIAAAALHPSNGEDGDNGEIAEPPNTGVLDRRQLLVGSSSLGMAGLPSLLLLPQSALGSPVQPPNLRLCTTPIDPGNGAAPVNCCLPVSTTITDFKLPTNLPMRTRLSAHQVPSSYVAKYNQAYKLLRQLPASDPRSYSQQANVHCAFCDAAYDVNGTQIEYQVHNSWLFFAWHRWYLYFHERILATLIKDDTFALPFWNWDSASGYTIPPIYNDSSSSLYDANRNPIHRTPAVVDLNYNFTESNLSAAAQLAANNTIMYRQMVSNAKTPSLFFGQAYRQGDDPNPGAGTIENLPHGTVHVWTGNPANPNDEDMGTFYSAGRDAIFHAHHSNIDRLWEVWKGLGGRRQDLTDADYLNTTFLFYDENAKLVRVKIGDSLNTTKLAYKYQDVPNAWLNAAPRSSTSSATAINFGPGGGPSSAVAGPLRDKLKEKFRKFKAGLKEFKERASGKIDTTVKALVKRPRKVRADDFDEEILVLEGVRVASDEKIKFDVYINLIDDDDDEDKGCDLPEFAASFVNVPHMGMKMGEGRSVRKSNFRIGIGEVLKELDAEDDDDFAITIVPRGKPMVPITIDNVRIEYE